MIKNYIKITEQEYNENMQATSEVREKASGVTGSSVECPAENENDYEEIDDFEIVE